MTFGDLLLKERTRRGGIDFSCGRFETGLRRRYVGHGTWRYNKDEIPTATISLQNLPKKKYVQSLLTCFL